MEIKNVAIIGPGGKVGAGIIQELLKDGPKFNLTGITRQTSIYTPPVPSITVKPVDETSSASLTAALEGQDAVLCCVGAHAVKFDAQKLLIDSAIAAGVKLFFADEYVGNIMRPQFLRMPAKFVGDKVQIRKYLEEKAEEGKIAWTALNGGPFFDMWLMKGPAGFDIRNRHARIYGTGENRLLWTSVSDMVLAAANMVRNPGPIINRPIFVCGVKGLTQNGILSAVEAELGEKFKVDHVDIKKLNEKALVALEKDEVGKAMKGLTLSAQFNEDDSSARFENLVENELVGIQAVSVQEAVKDAIHIWGKDVEVVESLFNVHID